ncbi:MAG: four helix bundle protein [Planctomycetaceae bacterium]
MFNFQHLEVWQLAIEFADLVYQATDGFPSHELYGLTTQLRRASVSVSSNIAEGSGRGSNREFQRFIGIAYGSLMECISQLEISRRRTYITLDVCRDLNTRGERISRMLSRLSDSLNRPEH